jgi:hypothetical protein
MTAGPSSSSFIRSEKLFFSFFFVFWRADHFPQTRDSRGCFLSIYFSLERTVFYLFDKHAINQKIKILRSRNKKKVFTFAGA